MAGITKEQVLEFIRNNDLDLDESYPRSDWWKFRDERDAYKKQRDELINDMQHVKRKAEAFDEIRKIEKRCYYVQYIEHLDMDKEGFESLEFIKNTLKVIRDFERGSDE